MPRQKSARDHRRRPRPDPRLILGLLLVGASVVGVWALVTGSDRTVVVYAAARALSAGDRIGTDDLVATKVALAGTESLYLTTVPGDGAIATRTVAKGELVPASALGDAGSVDSTRIVIPLQGQSAASLGPGSVVDLWSAAQDDHHAFGPPAVLVPSAAIVRMLEGDSLIGGRGRFSVELLVPKDRVALVLQSIANEDAISIVPVGLPLGG